MTGRQLGLIVKLAVVLAVGSQLAGCNVLGWGAQVFGPDAGAMVNVTAEYRGLDNQKVAVQRVTGIRM